MGKFKDLDIAPRSEILSTIRVTKEDAYFIHVMGQMFFFCNSSEAMRFMIKFAKDNKVQFKEYCFNIKKQLGHYPEFEEEDKPLV